MLRTRSVLTHDAIRARVETRIAAVDANAWDRCAGDDNPFVSHRFLRCLEDSGCLDPRTGWAAHHVLVEDAHGTLIAAAPAYVKAHSYGEYVFDHGWAEAYEQAGGRYYPKLLVAVPFTPVPGPRLLVHPAFAATGRTELLRALLAETKRIGASSLHINFCGEDEWRFLGAQHLLQRTGEQFHWTNRGYASFDAFLADLASRKRKAVRKERDEARAKGAVTIQVLKGEALKPAHWDAFFSFYVDTGGRKWGRPYLNQAFFRLLGERMADAVVLVLAFRAGQPIAGALNLRGRDCLYGRYWGCTETHRSLHFEVCYYQAIEYAIAHGLARVEAGAQGPHKLARGYLPTLTYSAHWMADPGLARAVEAYLSSERAHVDAEIAALAEHSPFRRES